MKQITINNTTELLEFIKRDEVTAIQATEIVCRTLKVVSIFELTKVELIELTENLVNRFFQNDSVGKPFFLWQNCFEVDVKDLCRQPETKKIIDDLEAKY